MGEGHSTAETSQHGPSDSTRPSEGATGKEAYPASYAGISPPVSLIQLGGFALAVFSLLHVTAIYIQAVKYILPVYI